MAATDILKVIPTMQSLTLLADNVKSFKAKKFKPVKQGMKNIIGIEMIKATAQTIWFFYLLFEKLKYRIRREGKKINGKKKKS